MTIQLDPSKTALVLIDLQAGIVGLPVQPLAAQDVLKASRTLAQACRRAGACVVYVRVDLSNMLPLSVDHALHGPSDQPIPASASRLVPEAGFQDGDLLITKRHWGAFGSMTGLEDALQERGIDTLILGGIATNFGVESTARQATSLGLQVVIAADACSSLSAAAHEFAMTTIFPLIARVRSTQELVDALA
ncbi:isochorismatase family protein [Pseudomonas sp. dw_358]|uniref:isochorismatase family protein n=1 Tax=Pseudomonas sp. dw_358 TaxID=2720083 RepID=UPI001BD4D6EF|nr:isochorismatase family protein [Pseudomonas sp. dw_358]